MPQTRGALGTLFTVFQLRHAVGVDGAGHSDQHGEGR